MENYKCLQLSDLNFASNPFPLAANTFENTILTVNLSSNVNII